MISPYKNKSKAGNIVHPKTSRQSLGARQIRSPETKAAFLQVLGMPMGSVYKACQIIGISRPTAYNWRNEDAAFREAWDAAIEDRIDQLEEEAERRAFEGVTRPISIAGVREEITEYSDTMLSLLLKGNRAAKYGSKTEVTGPGGGAIQHEVIVRFVEAKDEK